MDYSSQTKKPQNTQTFKQQSVPAATMALASHPRSTYQSQLPNKHRRYQLMKSGRSVLQPAAYTEDSYIYSQTVQYSPYVLDYNPYNFLEVAEQFNSWSAAASPAIVTALQPISVIDSTVIVPQVYPLIPLQQVLVPRQGPDYSTKLCKRRGLYKRPSLYQHESCNNQIETDLSKPYADVERLEDCLGAALLEEVEIQHNTINSVIKNSSEYKKLEHTAEGDSEAALNAYFNLPAELFLSPRKLKIIDPNEIIDLMCSAEMPSQDMLWLLDLELGHPKKALEKSFASYDVQSNMITPSDSPTSMHPGFARCSEEFRKTLLFYYDSIISSWYLGFVTYYGDYSVTRFQEWLTRIMDAYGMSWR